MKILKIIITSLGIFAASYFQLSCSKSNTELVAGIDTDLNSKALVQVVVATVGASRNYVYVDAAAITGAPLISGSVFPASSYGFNINGGVRGFLVKDTQTITTQLPLSFPENFQVGRHHTVFLYDTITSPKQKTVLDNIVVPVDTSSRIRFANFIYNPFDIPAVDVFSYRTGTTIFTNIPVTGVTEFIAYPSRAPLDTLYIRETGTLNQLFKVSIGTLTPKHNYTFVYRGSHRGTRTSSLYATY